MVKALRIHNLPRYFLTFDFEPIKFRMSKLFHLQFQFFKVMDFIAKLCSVLKF